MGTVVSFRALENQLQIEYQIELKAGLPKNDYSFWVAVKQFFKKGEIDRVSLFCSGPTS